MRTALTDLFTIEVPIVGASLGPWSTPELAAAVSNTGAVGSLGAVLRSPDQVRDEIKRVRELTDRPFIVNFSKRPFNAEAFQIALDERVPIISLAHAAPGDLPKRAHDIGASFVHMVHSVPQAMEAAADGADVIIAQGSEAGGFTGSISSLCLLPQVVDAVSPIPVLGAGGIADGRGLAVALLLGAAGINIGTRFLASVEAGVSEDWKHRIVEAESDAAVQITFADAFIPPVPGTYEGRPRVLRTPFVDEWNDRPEQALKERESLTGLIIPLVRQLKGDDLIAFTGQTTGLIHDIEPVADIINRIVAEAERTLIAAPKLVGA